MTVTPDDVRAAAARLEGVAVRTPAVRLPGDDDVWLKLESLQRTGSFKFRGAYNAVASLAPDARARGVLAGSSGNHAAALALAARITATSAVIAMPADAPAVKRASVEALGAEIVEFDRYGTDRDELVASIAADTGRTVVPAYDHPDVVAGAGTSALEVLEDVDGVDVAVVPTSGGGNLAGWSVALPEGVELYGVCPEASDAPRRSWETGALQRAAVGRTIADGLQLPAPGRLNFALWSGRVTEVVAVSDAEIVDALRVLALRGKVVAEPSGATALAGVLSGRIPVAGRRVAVLVSGGNVERAALARWLAS